MNHRRKNQIIIFFVFIILLSVPIFINDMVFRIIGIILVLAFVGLVIFLRDGDKNRNKYSLNKNNGFSDDKNSAENDLENEHDDSFKIISKPDKIELITEENYRPVISSEKTLQKPPDLKEKFEEIANEELPQEVGFDGQFSFVLDKILMLLKESYEAHTAIFLWYIKKSNKISIEKFASSATEISHRKFDVENDILSTIVQKGEPEVLYSISAAAENDIIRYYDAPQGIRSFVGVPLFFDKSLIGLLALDSKSPDSFGIETIFKLGRAVRLITIMISIFEHKFSEYISTKRLNGLTNFLKPLESISTPEELIEQSSKLIDGLISWDAFAFVVYNPINRNFKIAKVINNTSLKFVGENLEIDIENTLTGKCIASFTPVKIDDTSSGNFKRFSKVEDLSFDGSFLAIPLIQRDSIFGVLCFESLKKNSYSKADVEFLRNSTQFLSYALQSLSTQSMLKDMAAYDFETPALNRKTFVSRVQIELLKSKEFRIQSTLAVIRIDDFLEQESLFDSNPFTFLVDNLCQFIQNDLTIFNLFGRIDEKTFAVYFLNYQDQDVFVWAEKLRVKIVRQTLNISSKQSNYTISAGVISCNDKTDIDSILSDASLALKKAIDAGGNRVQKY